MSNIDTLLTNSLASHCLILDELSTCMVTELNSRCSSTADATRMKNLFIDPFVGALCDGTTVKSVSVQWMDDHFEGFTSGLKCLMKPKPPYKPLGFDDWSNEPIIEFLDSQGLRSFRKCNVEAIEAAVEFSSIFEPFDRNFDTSTYNVFTVLDMDIATEILDLARPMADCLAHEMKLLLPDRLCSGVDIVEQATKILDMFKFMLPVLPDEQDMIRDIILNPRPQPDLASSDRYSLALLGSGHVFDLKEDEWVASCFVKDDSMLLLAYDEYAIYKPSAKEILITSNSGNQKVLFNDTGVFWSHSFNTWVRLTEEVHKKVSHPPFPLLDILVNTDYSTYFTYFISRVGMITSFENPHGSNWMVFLRAGKGAHELGYGILQRGCGEIGTTTMTSVVEGAADVSSNCQAQCSGLTTMYDPCLFDCATSQPGLVDEVEEFKSFDRFAALYDRVSRNGAINMENKDYAPCSTAGVINNLLNGCLNELDLVGVGPTYDYGSATLTDTVVDLAILEPYILYGISAFAEEYITGSPERSFMGTPSSAFISIVDNTLLKDTMAKHCNYFGPLVSCVESKLPDYCPGTQESFIADYLEPLKTRYCTATSSNSPQVSQTVYDAMVAAKDVPMDEVACFIDRTITDSLEFDTNKLNDTYRNMVNRCEFKEIIFHVLSIRDDTRGEILPQVKELVKVARSPAQCVLKVAKEQCPDTDMSALVDKILSHVNRATAGVLGLDKEYFINTQQVNYGSRERVSMWVVGDPHLRTLDSSKFSYCQADGLVTYFLSEEGARFQLKGKNLAANESVDATALKEIYFQVWAPGAAYTDAPVLNYTVKNGVVNSTFDDGETDVVVGEFSIFLEMRDNGRTVIIQNINSGTLIAIQGFRDFFNMVMRTSRSYADTALGLFVAGCGASAVDVSEFNDNAAVESNRYRFRKRATVTYDECQTACSQIDEILREECTYDCLVLKDLRVGEAYIGAIAMEKAIAEKDVKINIWLPDLDIAPADNSAGGTMLSTVLMLCTLVLLVS